MTHDLYADVEPICSNAKDIRAEQRAQRRKERAEAKACRFDALIADFRNLDADQQAPIRAQIARVLEAAK